LVFCGTEQTLKKKQSIWQHYDRGWTKARVALLVNTADEIGSRAHIARGEAAGLQLGVAVVPFGVRDANALEGAISDKSQEMVVTHDGLFYVRRASLTWL
jgi:hypothetical protein